MADPPTFSSDPRKADLRKAMLARLRDLDPVERARASAALLGILCAAELWQQASCVLLFHPLRSEPDVTPLLEPGSARLIALPRVAAGGLTLHQYPGHAAALRCSRHGMLEPDPLACPPLAPSAIDLAIIPGLAFDPATGIRLGRGGGYYDRLLARDDFRAATIGIAFGFQLQEDLPADPHDQRVDYLLSATGLARAGTR